MHGAAGDYPQTTWRRRSLLVEIRSSKQLRRFLFYNPHLTVDLISEGTGLPCHLKRSVFERLALEETRLSRMGT